MPRFRGRVPGTGIYIDICSSGVPGVFLLTHCHRDHMAGLRDPSWRHGLLHCSHESAALLAHRSCCAGSVVRPHDLDVPWVLEDPLHPQRSLSATFLSANHCVGAVMIVIQGLPGGVLLHTGDFRYSDCFLQNPTLRQVASDSASDPCNLYLGHTFAAERIPSKRFPSKEQSIAQVLNLIDEFHSDRISA